MSNARNFAEVGRKIVCIGRNYKDHIAEMKAALPTKPVVFIKPSTSFLKEGQSIVIPPGCSDLHHEVELGVVIGSRGSNVSKDAAMGIVAGYCLALDMTARDLQQDCKTKGLPWEIAKGFDTSCPVGEFIPLDKIPDPHAVDIWCDVNGQKRQRGNTKDMIFSIPTLIEYVTKYFTLEPGDVLLTGTPEGVGPVKSGDTIQAGLGNVTKINFSVSQK